MTTLVAVRVFIALHGVVAESFAPDTLLEEESVDGVAR